MTKNLKKKTFYNCIVPMEFLQWEIWVAFPRESQLWQSCAPQPTMHAGCVSIFYNPWNSDVYYRIFNVHADVNARKLLTGVYGHHKRVCSEKWLWEKNPFCCTKDSNLRQRHASPMLHQLSYIPTPGARTNKMTPCEKNCLERVIGATYPGDSFHANLSWAENCTHSRAIPGWM